MEGKEITIRDICAPVFIVSTVQDHIAPWRSVYKFNIYSNPIETAFVLTSGGHNAGIISEPAKMKRTYRISTRKRSEKYIDPDTWFNETPVSKASWWIPWEEWLSRHSSPEQVAPPNMGLQVKNYKVIMDAPVSSGFVCRRERPS